VNVRILRSCYVRDILAWRCRRSSLLQKLATPRVRAYKAKHYFAWGYRNLFYRPQSDRAEPSALTVHNRIVPNTSSGTVAPAETECFACTGMLGDCEWVVWMGEPPIQVDRELSSDWNNQQFLDEERKG
jgi:hypothetical protein